MNKLNWLRSITIMVALSSGVICFITAKHTHILVETINTQMKIMRQQDEVLKKQDDALRHATAAMKLMQSQLSGCEQQAHVLKAKVVKHG